MNRISDLSKEEYENYKPEGLITDMPPKFNEWMEKNADRIAAAAERDTLPYFLKDNRGKNLGIFDEYIKENSHMKERKKTPEEKAAIQKAWEERKKHDELIRKVAGQVGVGPMGYKETYLLDFARYRHLKD